MRLLDLFCGAGGCSVGYARAGFEVVGVDIEPHKTYPYAIHVGDAMVVLRRLLAGELVPFTHRDGRVEWLGLADFDAIHASPPCQAYSITRHTHSVEHPDLYVPVREALTWTGLPWVIENVPGVPMRDYLLLCGSMFDLGTTDDDGRELRLQRHRLFESNVFLMAPGPCRHDARQVGGVYGGGNNSRDRAKVRRGGYTPRAHIGRALMGIDWMGWDDLTQAIPPAYTEHIGEQLLHALTHAA